MMEESSFLLPLFLIFLSTYAGIRFTFFPRSAIDRMRKFETSECLVPAPSFLRFMGIMFLLFDLLIVTIVAMHLRG